jgi:predicted RNase H-like HicB family nuclease
MFYPAAIHKDPDSDYGVTIPDLPGCFSAGETVDEAIANAAEAIECHIEGLLIEGEEIPLPGIIEHHQHHSDYEGAFWALVPVDLSKLSGATKRVNVSMPERILGQIDAYAERRGETRSGFLAAAALEYIHTHSSEDVV